MARVKIWGYGENLGLLVRRFGGKRRKKRGTRFLRFDTGGNEWRAAIR